MNVTEFITKWQKAALSERSAAQQHFLDLCEVFDHPKPAEADPVGASFTFEKGATKQSGGQGWADVWKRGFFGIEYKGKHKDLDAAYKQLLLYREALENPPLLIVCDMDRIVIHTNFTSTATAVFDIALRDMGEPRNIEILRAVFHAPEKLKPGATSAAITAEAAQRIAEIAQSLRERGLDPQAVAHFLDRIVFSLFAEDIGLLPEGLFTRVVEKAGDDPERFAKLLGQLFHAMAEGGDFGLETIRHFNGNLFTDGVVLELTLDEIARIRAASALDWSAVDASIFGTLFERGLDPSKRGQLGAHYTSREDIETLVEPVVMQPLRREWAEIRAVAVNLLATGRKKPRGGGLSPMLTSGSFDLEGRASSRPPSRSVPATTKRGPPDTASAAPAKKPSAAVLAKARKQAGAMVHGLLQKLSTLRILDPACGSGNFLYVTLQKLKDLEKEIILFANRNGIGGFIPLVGPWQFYGIEVNAYAHDLAQMTVWIGYLQWIRFNGFGVERDPILRRTDNFQCRDAILDLSDPEHPKEPDWPKVDFIVGNPPFLGGNKIRQELGDVYVDKLFGLYRGRVPSFSDLCCYWFERARSQIEKGRCKRAGLLATQGIRGGANRNVLERIKASGDIFFAESDRPWILDGANVHVSMVGFDNKTEDTRILDSQAVSTINANLAATADTTQATTLKANSGICFMGPSPKAPFDIPEDLAVKLLCCGGNVNGRPNSDVVRPVASAVDLTKRDRHVWTVDFAVMSAEQASRYEAAFEYVKTTVYPIRSENRRRAYAERWWQYAEARPGMRKAFLALDGYLATPGVAKHRVFVKVGIEVLCNQGTLVFARSDDYFFGVLHSRLHEVWALKLGTRLETRPRYTPTTCFETFPLPRPTEEQEAAIGAAAKELDTLRNAWLNPPEWTREEVLEFPGSADGPWARYVHDPDERGIGTVRWPRTVAHDEACAKKLAKRTLTNLYNERPAWLDLAHKKLDDAVFAAYGWDPGMSDEEILENLLALNRQRAAE